MEELGEAAQTLDELDNAEDPSIRHNLIQHYYLELLQTTALGIQQLERLRDQGYVVVWDSQISGIECVGPT